MKPLHVLLLEDSPLDAELTLAQMEESEIEHEVVRVDKRAEFLAQLKAGPCDLILADYLLPAFDGMEALTLAQELRPEVPFIFVSGVLGEELAIETLKKGATDYVLKQRLERLTPSVKRALREAEERAERRKAEAALQALSEASSVLASSLDYETTLTNIAQLGVPFFADFCLVDVVADDNSVERVAVAHAEADKEVLVRELSQYPPDADGVHPLLRVLRDGKSVIISEMPEETLIATTRNERHQQVLRQLGGQCFMAVPLLARGRVLGGISFIRRQAHSYSDADLALAEDLARRAALAMDNARLYREAQEANRTKDEFLATISHELRTPLTAILGWTNLLRTHQLQGADATRAFESIERNAKAQAELIADILDVSRVITGKFYLDISEVDLAQIVTSAIEAAHPAAAAKNIHVDLQVDAAVAQIPGDARRLQQIVWNLLANAIKFTPRDGQVQVQLRRAENHVQIIVRDNGQGIEPEFLPHVFERFRQADSTSTRKHGGLGLGLAIVRHLVESHGGTVQADSEGAGKGASFTVNLPLAITVPEAPIQSVQETKDVESALSPAKIESVPLVPVLPSLEGLQLLVVDDETDARVMVATALKQYGAVVTSAGSGREGFQAFEQSRPDVIISDVAMPDEDGYSLMRRIRELEKQQQDSSLGTDTVPSQVPAIALTAYTRAEDRQRALEAGFQIHVAKPVKPDELMAIVAELAKAVGPGL